MPPLMLEMEPSEGEQSSLMVANDRKLHASPRPSSCRKSRAILGLLLACIGLVLLVVPWLYHSGGITMISRAGIRLKPDDNTDFQCPATQITSNQNNEEGEAQDTYGQDKQPVFDEHFLDTFRSTKFDGWQHTFDQLKARKYDFKAKYFAPYLKNGSSIYESACGLGLNLYLTLEILQEMTNLGNLTVYGNEYVASNAMQANPMLELLLKHQGAGNQLGSVCQADSTNLSFVPSNRFDLVFTGYISPLWDPLEFGLDFATNYDRLKTLCRQVVALDDTNNATDSWIPQTLLAMAQKKQEDWFNVWVQELVRIAKPGAPIIVEEVAFPYCDILHDYGGVSQDFWKTGSDVYGWDIDPNSIAFEYKNDHRKRRYHVFMRKRDHSSSTFES